MTSNWICLLSLPAVSRCPLWTLLFNVTGNRSGVLNQRECQTVERSVYLLHFTKLSQTAYSFMLIAARHCAMAVVVELLLERGPSKVGADARQRFFQKILQLYCTNVCIFNTKQVQICGEFQTKKWWEVTGLVKDSLKHKNRLCMFLNHCCREHFVCQSQATIQRESCEAQQLKANTLDAAYKLYQNAVPTFDDFGCSHLSPATCDVTVTVCFSL